jgi:hypothetical protein
LGNLILGFYSKTIYSQEDPEQWLSIWERINSVEIVGFETVYRKNGLVAQDYGDLKEPKPTAGYKVLSLQERWIKIYVGKMRR